MKRYFQSYDLQNNTLNVIEQLKFKHPTEIQHRVIPHALKMKSIIGQSQTGTGKTHAYLIPMFDRVNSEQDDVQKIIIAPTRELAMQIFEEVKKVISFSNEKWTAKLVIGGTDKQRLQQKLQNPPHIIVGTPGRILDFIEEGTINASTVNSVVVDEADLLIDLGLIEEVDQILSRMYEEVQIMVYSATIPKGLQPFLKKYLTAPEHIQIEEDVLSPEQLEHRLVPLRHRQQADLIVEASKLINPYIALVFVNKKEHADALAEQLLDKGLEVGVVHGGLKPRERKRVLKELRSLRYEYIVATDLAARGIDIPGISHVFNAEMPHDVDTYIHRVGRTARAGLEGTAVSFYQDKDLTLIESLESRGIEFFNYDIKKGEWVQVKKWNERKQRQKADHELESEAWKKVKKQKKVKPGYKKKMQNEKDQIKKQMKQKQSKKGKRR
ncbi:ATP-dependent RNA helicase CshB [Alkalibacillus filiformis]|uniref:ATP-dependent RNA helicase CshB n=1 Tax=Alkalibacillus filiformis TaxID=200990 RepID=A0ABU0DS73_9BACI|nr:DEAD/DEAH box helicase [Alkalibacillus filiformis]MDQ0351040.1 ATP-dependent RNA helicase CshB [Alkalibacillus filiformis]